MMTFKEIDERIAHYEDELNWGAGLISKIDTSLNSKRNPEHVLLLENKKLKIEFFCFVTTSYIDLLCTYRNLKRSKSDWEKSYNVKIAYLIAYETINTYNKYKGDIYKTLKKEEKEDYQQFFRMLNDELSDFKYEYDYDSVMSKIRNKSTAHYDKEFLEFYKSYEVLNKPESKNIIRSFLNFINPLHYFTYGLLEGKLDMLLFVNSWLT